MGMDVYGKNPTNETGKYFRNNAWWWHPLANYCCDVAPDIADACKHWQSNDGDGLDKNGSIALAAALRAKIASAETAAYAENYAAKLAAIPDESCQFCEGSGIRRDAVGISMGQPGMVVGTDTHADPSHPRYGKTGWCNGCRGTGRTKPYEKSYPFSVENVERFCDFLENCGGFKIL